MKNVGVVVISHTQKSHQIIQKYILNKKILSNELGIINQTLKTHLIITIYIENNAAYGSVLLIKKDLCYQKHNYLKKIFIQFLKKKIFLKKAVSALTIKQKIKILQHFLYYPI